MLISQAVKTEVYVWINKIIQTLYWTLGPSGFAILLITVSLIPDSSQQKLHTHNSCSSRGIYW